MKEKNKLIWFVAAGTGGHIFPGINVAKALKKDDPTLEFLFFGTRDRLEAKLIPAQNFKIKFLAAGRWKGVGWGARFAGIFKNLWGIVQVFGELFRSRPKCLISVGGYVSVPVAIPCYLLGVPIFLIEPNVRAGLANRFLSKLSQLGFSVPGSDSKAKLSCKILELGNPIRQDIQPIFIREKVTRILVLGGSLGALSLCRASLKLAADLNLAATEANLFLQCGEKNYQQALQWQKEFQVEVCTVVQPFINDVAAALKQADLVIARAGASTVAELAAAAMPTIFVPFPHAADNHQHVYALDLQNIGAARLVDERDSSFDSRLKAEVKNLSFSEQNYALRKKLSESFQKWSRPQAATDIAKSVLLFFNGKV